MPEDFLKSCEQHIINILGPVSILEAAGNSSGQLEAATLELRVEDCLSTSRPLHF
jgi:hypothetical protein